MFGIKTFRRLITNELIQFKTLFEEMVGFNESINIQLNKLNNSDTEFQRLKQDVNDARNQLASFVLQNKIPYQMPHDPKDMQVLQIYKLDDKTLQCRLVINDMHFRMLRNRGEQVQLMETLVRDMYRQLEGFTK